MKRADYISTKAGTGGANKYPLSTQTLDFIQSQLMLLQELSYIAGSRYVLKEPDGTNAGVVVIDGEVFPLAASPVRSNSTKCINVSTVKEDILADGETYKEARIQRNAAYSGRASGPESYEISTFQTVDTNAALSEKLKQQPQYVLNLIKPVLDEKLSVLVRTGLTQEQLDAMTTPCVVSCADSVDVLGATTYNLYVRKIGSGVQQELVNTKGERFIRIKNASGWAKWGKEEDNFHVEVKIARGVVYLRHGRLSPAASIVLLRKKKRSRFRATGGDHAYSYNKGIRKKRQPKTQYVHFKGIVLSKGEPGKWYVPKCIKVADKAVDGNLIDRELPDLCKSIIQQRTKTVQIMGSTINFTYYTIQGMRKMFMGGSGSKVQHNGYARIAVQAALVGDTGSKDTGGEMVRMKYRLSRQKVMHPLTNPPKYIWKRSFSLE